jgi:hypothetical protein
MEYNTIVMLSAISLCILVFLRSILIGVSGKKQNKAIEALQKELQIIKDNENREMEFQKSLRHAEVSNELQKSRAAYSSKKERICAPERYGYAQSMFQSGMTTDKIASALGMSGYEINQLLKLTNLRVPHN